MHCKRMAGQWDVCDHEEAIIISNCKFVIATKGNNRLPEML